MQTRTILALVACCAFCLSCEDSELQTPTDAILSVFATAPTTVSSLDPSGVHRFSTISAQLLDAGAAPLSGRPISFFPDGGTMTFNACVDNTCTQTGDACTSLNDCPEVLSLSVDTVTNANGIATATLAVDADDPETVVVTAVTGTISGTVSVFNELGEANNLPTASITSSIATACEIDSGLICVYDANNVTFQAVASDAELDPLCYAWVVNLDSLGGVVRKTGFETFITVSTGGVEGRATVDLYVFDEWATCTNSTLLGTLTQEPHTFVSDTIGLCQNEEPNAVISAPVQVMTLPDGGGSVSFQLQSTSSDPEGTVLDTEWDCGNGIQVTGDSVTCTYVGSGVFNVELEVEDQGFGEPEFCARRDIAGIALQVLPPNNP